MDGRTRDRKAGVEFLETRHRVRTGRIVEVPTLSKDVKEIMATTDKERTILISARLSLQIHLKGPMEWKISNAREHTIAQATSETMTGRKAGEGFLVMNNAERKGRVEMTGKITVAIHRREEEGKEGEDN